ncbi:hypothetical protein JAAARDRAFT_209380 [Jaapia argillacea MUCL 33604]|uniref:Uncharacterized protein n=1 Tax=Jaapia argillacea MUCL 33604 TaxID=933084 RepID=A0A067PHE4_9AGAM|nr:hypothetical protein JAAARDRAFT_209380 [Jaapia argillacea MUCL 33604]
MTTTSRNPFRTPRTTPNPTGLSQTPSQYEPPSQPPPTTSSQPQAVEAVSSPPLPPRPALNSPSPSYSTIPPSHALSQDDLDPAAIPLPPDAEPPPAYTASPDTRHGESTIELGPRRPFQPAPIPAIIPPAQQPRGYGPSPYQPLQQQPTGQQTRVVNLPTGRRGLLGGLIGEVINAVRDEYLSPQPTGSRSANNNSWSNNYPGTVGRQTTGSGVRRASSSTNLSPPQPPNRHTPSRSEDLSSLRPPMPVPSASDFARDFYAVGEGPESVARELETSSAPSSPTRPSASRYAPPTGAPPPRSSPSTTSRAGGASRVEDDGKPTEVPVSGHPLLRDGKVLVYPTGYECWKCNNTGYKERDPTHPCSKCWEKYSKPYTSAIAYSPWTPSAKDPRYQRPLPPNWLRPGHGQRADGQRGFGSFLDEIMGGVDGRMNGNGMSRSRSDSGRPRSTPGLVSPPPPTHPYLQPLGASSSYSSRSQPSSRMPGSYSAAPVTRLPPGAPVVQPGDPRIGGRLCRNCGGEGVVRFFILEDRCDVCGGLGRVF